MKECIRCGQVLNNDATYCNRCGGTKLVIKDKNSVQPQQNIKTQQNVNNVQSNRNVQNQNIRNNVPVNPNIQQRRRPNISNQPNINKQTNISNQQNNVISQQNINNQEQQFIDDIQPTTSVKEWIITMLMLLIPIWNIFYILKNIKNVNIPDYKRNYLKAFAIYYIAVMVISVAITMIL